MSVDESLIREVSILTLLLKEGRIEDAQFVRLESLLQADKLARQYYLMLVNTDLFLEDSDVLGSFDGQRELSYLRELAEYEKTALTIKSPQVQPQRQLVQKVVYPPREKHKVSKFNIAFLMLNAAAVVFLMLFVKFTPSNRPVEVATLSDSMNARWANPGTAVQKAARIVTGHSICLNEGLIEVIFDNGARLVAEAPADFQILTDDRIDLTYGKLYAVVPQDAVGFSVCTPNTKIIDLGTEFGVETDFNGNTQLSVLKGRTLLLAGEKDKTKMDVCEGTGKKIWGQTGEISDIGCQSNYFVRAINSESNIAWRGQKTIDLADIVRNGNGLGTGNSDVRLNHETGFTNEVRPNHTSTFNAYLLIKDHPFIDGIFIPNGKTVVSSQGDVFEEFPWTNGVYCADIYASPDPGLFIIDGQPRTIQFDGQEYSTRGKSCIVMQYSNHGITFDLNAIRDRYKLTVDRFTSHVGLIDFDKKRCNANFYVLVDGQARYSLLGYSQKGVLNDISIELKDSDRFLTLVTCENVDQVDYMANSTLRENWCVFAEPVLVLE